METEVADVSGSKSGQSDEFGTSLLLLMAMSTSTTDSRVVGWGCCIELLSLLLFVAMSTSTTDSCVVGWGC